MTDNAWGKKLWAYRKNLGISRKKFADMLDINEGTLRSYETQLRKPGYETFQKIELFINKEDHIEKGDNMKELIETKNKLIQSLENEKRLMAELLNTRTNSITSQRNAYGAEKADIQLDFDVKIDWRGGIAVKYKADQTNIRLLSDKLGYTYDEMYKILEINKMVPYKDHKIHQLRNNVQKKRMLKMISDYLKSFNNVKVTTNSIVAEIPVYYQHKSGSEYMANVEYRINWISGMGEAHMRWTIEA